MPTWLLCLLAALAMVGQDVTLTMEVQAENRHLPYVAGTLDSVGFILQLATYGVGINSIIDHGLSARTIWVLVALTIANFTGTALGTILGDRWVHAENLLGVTA